METIALSKPNFGAELDDIIFALHKKASRYCGMVWYGMVMVGMVPPYQSHSASQGSA